MSLLPIIDDRTVPEEHASPPASPLSETSYVSLHVTKYCNLRCSYCFEAAPVAGPRSLKESDFMSLQTVRTTMERVCRDSSRPRIKVLFFGGEPLLIGERWLAEASEILRSLAKAHSKELELSITTNGTLITDSVAEMFVREQIGVCLSLDGPPALQNESRGGARALLKGLACLQKVDINPNVICIIGPSNVDQIPQVLEFFLEHGITKGRLSPMNFAGRAVESCGLEFETFDEPIDAVIQVLDHMLETNGEGFVDRTLQRRLDLYYNSLRGLNGAAKSYDCYTRTCWAGEGYLAVDQDGETYPCSRCVAPEYSLGRIDETAPSGNKRASILHDLHSKGMEYFDCDKCPAKVVCFAGCAAHNKEDDRNFVLDCLLTKRIYARLEENRDEFIQLASTLRRTRRSPAGSSAVSLEDENVGYLVRSLRLAGLSPLWSDSGLTVVAKEGAMYLIDVAEERAFEIDDATYQQLLSASARPDELAEA